MQTIRNKNQYITQKRQKEIIKSWKVGTHYLLLSSIIFATDSDTFSHNICTSMDVIYVIVVAQLLNLSISSAQISVSYKHLHR